VMIEYVPSARLLRSVVGSEFTGMVEVYRVG
jgi:hypothetical protein